MKKAVSVFTHHAFLTAAIVNGITTSSAEETVMASPAGEREPLWYMRPVNIEPVRMQTQMQRQHKYMGCKSAGCRTLDACICRCKDCTRWCKYRGVTIRDEGGTVYIRFASGKLIVYMPREEYENIKVHWEKLGLKLEPSAPAEVPDGVTPV